MSIKKEPWVLFMLILTATAVCAQENSIIKVHFLYGSKPKKEFRDTERKWFGGKLGGHVGIEYEPDQVIDFMRRGKFHWIAKKKNKHSRFVLRPTSAFWEIFGSPASSVKKATVTIPLDSRAKWKMDSLVKVYSHETPYDYAFIGMRCASATYDMLSQVGLLRQYSYGRTYRKIFYPKKLRKRLFAKAIDNQWGIVMQEGTYKRKWEED